MSSSSGLNSGAAQGGQGNNKRKALSEEGPQTQDKRNILEEDAVVQIDKKKEDRGEWEEQPRADSGIFSLEIHIHILILKLTC